MTIKNYFKHQYNSPEASCNSLPSAKSFFRGKPVEVQHGLLHQQKLRQLIAKATTPFPL
ncbi:MAG: hypothetical protein KME46_01060 [Brasilonema angustatum HA4187-MV1]|nr:hypothetical protein [Brasilonema angustatum HA4187-MV1]